MEFMASYFNEKLKIWTGMPKIKHGKDWRKGTKKIG